MLHFSGWSNALIAGIAMAAITQAQAVTLTYGSPTSVPGTDLAHRPALAGTTVAPDWTQPFAYNGLSGTVTSRVVQESMTGTLDFYWRVDLISTGGPVSPGQPPLDSIGSLRLFGHWSEGANPVEGDWRLDSIGTSAGGFAFATPPNLQGNPNPEKKVDFSLALSGAGASSKFFFLHTDATSFDQSGTYIVRTGMLLDNPVAQSANFRTYAPAVPEPQTWALALVGMLALTAVRRRITN